MPSSLDEFYQNIANISFSGKSSEEKDDLSEEADISDEKKISSNEDNDKESFDDTSGTYQLPIRGGEYKKFGGYYTQSEEELDHPKGHPALDIFAPGTEAAIEAKKMSEAMTLGKNVPVFPIGNGVVVKVGSSGVGGNFCVIEHPQDPGMYSYYAHLSSISATKGMEVSSTTEIGKNGNTGSAKKSAPHVHLEVWIATGAAPGSNPMGMPRTKVNPETVIGKPYGSIGKKASNKIKNLYKTASLFYHLVKNNY
jgi:murein DD-endopeptidase MepM/ murein hydrolase activator NlpD